MKVSANLGFLWNHLPLPDRIDAAARAGFRAVELHQPFEMASRALKRRCADAGVSLLGINTGKGARPGDAGLAAVPGREAEAQALITEAIDYAAEAGATAVHLLAGSVGPADRERGRAALLANLAHAGERSAGTGLTLLLEPLNPVDAPVYFYSRSAEALEIIAASGLPNAKLMLDLYHVAMVGDDPRAIIDGHFDHIGHVQIAGVPGRREPDVSAAGFGPVLARLDALGYDGWIGAEYRPAASVEEGLGWCRSALRAAE